MHTTYVLYTLATASTAHMCCMHAVKQFDIPISKNQAPQILFLKHDVYKTS